MATTATAKNLTNQFAHLTTRLAAIKRLPMLMRATYIDELLDLQLSLLGTMVDVIAKLERGEE